MRTLLVIACVVLSMAVFGNDSDPNTVRHNFFQATQNADERADLVAFLTQSGQMAEPFRTAYLGASKMLLAECGYTPWTKYNHFTEGKKLLEEAIASTPNEAEFRYLRFMIQLNAPSFLGYTDDVATDYAMIKHAIRNANTKASWMDHFAAFERAHAEQIVALTSHS
jgi:hypothetical protein